MNRILIEDSCLAVYFGVLYYALLAFETGGHPTHAGHLFQAGYLLVAWALMMDFGLQLTKEERRRRDAGQA